MAHAYFATTRRGEIPEMQEGLNSTKLDKKRDALRKVIACMTVGKDVSSLFPHVVKCMETTNVELKKLVYLYIINYAKSQPDMAIMAVNSFRKDSRHPTNPLIRALAVRTMGCIRVSKITEYLLEPLKDALTDNDPYVRKTAAICVLKLFDIAPDLLDDEDFVGILSGLLNDGNAMVVSNAVATIYYIGEVRQCPVFECTAAHINSVLAALNESSEWGQVYILDFIAKYSPSEPTEAENIIDRVLPRLAHGNSAVVLSAIKVVMKFLDFVTNPETIRNICRKLTPSLVSLISSEPEIQFIALRCINLIIQKRPLILEKEIKVFFCKYNDPIYVKMEKLEIMVKLADLKNIDQVLHELKEYSTEVDVEFVKRSVRAIGRCAIKLERAVERCISCLLELIHMRVNYVVQEAMIVIRDIFRKYPNRFEMIIKDLFANLDSLDNPEAKASMIWIIGEYAERIEDAEAQMGSFLENFLEETAQVQLALLTATVKLFLKKPEETEGMITSLLKTATEEVPNPDLRDRAYMYWRMLSNDPEVAKAVVLGEKPTISEELFMLESSLLDRLIEYISTIASIYHKPPEAVSIKRDKDRVIFEREIDREELVEYDSTGQQLGQAMSPIIAQDLLGLGEFEYAAHSKNAKVPLQSVLPPTSAGVNSNTGLHLEAAFQRDQGEILLELRITNMTSTPLSDFIMKFNKNCFRLDLAEPLSIDVIPPGMSHFTQIKVSSSGESDNSPPSVPFIVQMALKCSLDIFYFTTPCMYSVLLVESGKLTREAFRDSWLAITDSNVFVHAIPKIHSDWYSIEKISKRLEHNNIFIVASTTSEDGETVLFTSSRDVTNECILSEMRIPGSLDRISVSCRVMQAGLAPLFIQCINFLIATNS